MRIAIMHMGAPAGGMNAATRAATRYCFQQGHTPLAIYNGFRGLLDDNVEELTWLGVDTWMSRGGSELGTNRALPSIDIGAVAAKFQKFNLQGLMLIGGFDVSATAKKASPAEVGGIPKLYWIDYLGTMAEVPYGAHGYGSYFALSLLDRCVPQFLAHERSTSDAVNMVLLTF